VIGHLLATGLGVASIAAGIAATSHHLPTVVGVVLVISGVLMPVLAWKSWHRSRAAWSFLSAIVAVCGIVNFFGATKIRGVLGVGLWTAFDLAALQFVTLAALAIIRADYRDDA
jgi:uncharacterized membrane protein HdeD (DUF308 family)